MRSNPFIHKSENVRSREIFKYKNRISSFHFLLRRDYNVKVNKRKIKVTEKNKNGQEQPSDINLDIEKFDDVKGFC